MLTLSQIRQRPLPEPMQYILESQTLYAVHYLAWSSSHFLKNRLFNFLLSCLHFSFVRSLFSFISRGSSSDLRLWIKMYLPCMFEYHFATDSGGYVVPSKIRVETNKNW